jgi:hypothetical protein
LAASDERFQAVRFTPVLTVQSVVSILGTEIPQMMENFSLFSAFSLEVCVLSFLFMFLLPVFSEIVARLLKYNYRGYTGNLFDYFSAFVSEG